MSPKNMPLPAFKTPTANRSSNMAKIRSGDTKPEMSVRRIVHAAGFRYRLHCSDLPGKPDIVFVKYRRVVLVHGCFWHGHNCARAHTPRTNAAYWSAKIAGNIRRDIKNVRLLRKAGWRVTVIWECSARAGTSRLIKALERDKAIQNRVQ